VRIVRPLLAAVLVLLVTAGPASAWTLGARVIHKGDRGADVGTLQRVLIMKGYRLGAPDGIFGKLTKRAVRDFQRQRLLTVDGIVGPQTVAGLASNWHVRTATLYGPGLWGNRTACGGTLRKGTYGIAHRTLPCGRRVPVFRRGRLAIFRVIDRGPYTDGVSVDLTAAAARKVGMSTTGKIRAGY
jgi:peptidoglycan hydrolase-like protein with peptidoglycan-binding domain